MSILSTLKNLIFNASNSEPTIRFKCDVQGYEVGQPVQRAQDIKPDWMVKQAKDADRTNTPKFSSCPGMHDYYRAGYIIPAWEDFEIIVTKTEATVIIGNSQHFVCKPFERMQYSVLTGAANIDEDIKPHALKLPCPWKVFTKPGYSAFVMPALFHSPFLRDLFLYPGINDYDAYHTINVMFSPLKEMHVKIYAGTPMLQVIPYKREDVTCEVGPINQKENGEANFTYRSKLPGLYRKSIHKKKKFSINHT
jgi:hypothetical protein